MRWIVGVLSLAFSSMVFAGGCDIDKHSALVVKQLLSRVEARPDKETLWQQWELLTKDCRKKVTKDDETALEDFLFLGYVGYRSGTDVTKGYMISQVYPLYEQMPKTFLDVLSSRTLLVESTCYYIARYLEDKAHKTVSTQLFLQSNASLFFEALSSENAKGCLKQF